MGAAYSISMTLAFLLPRVMSWSVMVTPPVAAARAGRLVCHSLSPKKYQAAPPAAISSDDHGKDDPAFARHGRLPGCFGDLTAAGQRLQCLGQAFGAVEAAAGIGRRQGVRLFLRRRRRRARRQRPCANFIWLTAGRPRRR